MFRRHNGTLLQAFNNKLSVCVLKHSVVLEKHRRETGSSSEMDAFPFEALVHSMHKDRLQGNAAVTEAAAGTGRWLILIFFNLSEGPNPGETVEEQTRLPIAALD